VSTSLHPSLFLHHSAPPPHPPSFPTRRSSDLSQAPPVDDRLPARKDVIAHHIDANRVRDTVGTRVAVLIAVVGVLVPAPDLRARSEEHTSELQSLTNLVCRLLLEKKKKNISHI